MAPTRSKLFHFRRGEFILVGAIVLIISSLLISRPQSAKCQWYKLNEFRFRIRSVYFINEIAENSKVGFVGMASPEVFRTSDGGISWIPTSSNFASQVTNFCFRDSLLGWASSGNQGVRVGQASCHQTTDGGNTWQAILDGLSPVEASSVFFHKPTNLLFVTAWSGGTKVSSNLGTTWSTISNKTNGIAFVNDNDGIMTRVSDGGVVFYPTLRTIDGGLTWLQTNFLDESWQPLAIKGTQTFFCVGDLSNNVYRSDDGGVTWSIISNIQSNGHITGTLNKLFIQNTTPGLGILVSIDQGVTWKSLCGPFTQEMDTRFFVKDNYIYVGDSYLTGYSNPSELGRLWVNTTGNSSGERLLLSHTSGNREFALTAGDNWKTDIALPDTFSTIQWLKLDSLSFTLRFEGDVLSLKDAIAASGWRVVTAQESLGKVLVKLVRESGSDRGVPVATVNFQANIAREKESDVYIDSVFYNAGEFTNCEVLASEKLHITINDECGDSTLREFINSKPILEIVSIHPNPTNGDITVDFRTLVDGDISLEVYDNNVRGLIREVIPVKAGITSKTLDLSQFFGGAFFVQLTLGKDVVTGKFVKQ